MAPLPEWAAAVQPPSAQLGLVVAWRRYGCRRAPEEAFPLPRVLIVDDATVMRTVLRTILTKNGFEVCGEAADGDEAIRTYSELKPDVVTMDIIMPKLTGIEALKVIVASDPAAKIIMCTADNTREMVINSFKAGAKDYVIKPFSVERLLEAMKKATGG